MAGSNIGMMDPAYFVGRKAILSWLNDTFSMHLSRIEDTASGAVACLILDAIYPGEVPMAKVRWDAKSPHEFVENYKIVQRIFDKKGIDKHIEVEKLCRAKYQDNLENMQWFKSFYDKNYAGQPYDALARRAKGKGADATVAFTTVAGGVPGGARGHVSGDDDDGGAEGAAAPAAAAARAGARAPGARSQSKGAPGSPTAAGTAGTAKTRSPAGVALATSHGASNAGPAGSTVAQLAAANKKVTELTQHVTDLRMSVEALERERDFYFGKLRDIEVLLQTYTGPDKETVDAIFKIMYATEDDFVSPDAVENAPGSGAENELQ